MSISRTIILLALIMLSQSALRAQSAYDMGFEYPRTLSDQVIDPSPDAAAMIRYKDCPVSYATGTANVNIPLLEWSSGDINMNLSISYHTGGIKVKDKAGYIGLGWSLNGIGRVSRQVCSMPDETRPFISSFSEASTDNSILPKILMYELEACYDRYNYDFPGYSGSFIISGDSIIHFSYNGVKIERKPEKTNPNATDVFIITTPEGLRYTFAQKEICDRYNRVHEGACDIYDLSYSVPTVWNLTEIKSLVSSETVNISYCVSDKLEFDQVPRLYNLARRWCHNSELDCYLTSVYAGSEAHTTYKNRAIPLEIKGKNFSVSFESEYVDGKGSNLKSHALRSITLKDIHDNDVRRIELDNDQLFEDRRLKLDGITISSGEKIIDKRTFTYYDGYSFTCRDFFGYANGITFPGINYESIIDINTMELNNLRKSDKTAVKAWSLASITEATGAVTTFRYEPSIWRPNAANADVGNIQNGIVVSEIEVYDPITQRKRLRKFSYDEPVMSVDLTCLDKEDFISLSGVKTFDPPNKKDEYSSIYTLTATMTESSRNAGVPAENMVIYYGKVTENLSGTGIYHPIKTEYQYDLSYCLHPGGKMKRYADSSTYEPTPTYAFDIHLGRNIFYVWNLPLQGQPRLTLPSRDSFNQIFRAKITTGGFSERVNPQPLLVKQIHYEYRDGDYHPIETVENTYSSHKKTEQPISIYVQSNVYKTLCDGEYDYNLIKYNSTNVLNPIDHWTNKIIYDDIRLAATNVTRHYADGNTRRISKNIYYSGMPYTLDFEVPEVHDCITQTTDSLLFPATSLRPVTTITNFGHEYFGTATIRAEAVNTPFFKDIAGKGILTLPVSQRWFVKRYVDVDSLDLRYCYSNFNVGLQPNRITMTGNGLDTIATQKIISYAAVGQVSRMVDSDGTEYKYEWQDDDKALVSKSILFNGTESGLVYQYTHKPFVGYTSILAPSGKHHKYIYRNGELYAEENTSGITVAKYSKSLYTQGARNILETKSFSDDGVTFTKRVFHDGLGLPIQSFEIGDGSNTAICSAIDYDAADRPIRQWQPVPVSTSDSIASNNLLKEMAETVYGDDQRPFSSIDYREASGENPAAAYSPGEALSEYPARTEYRCNNMTSELRVRRYRLSDNGTVLFSNGIYPAGQLDAVKSSDPDGHTLITFSDWMGYKVLERRKLSDSEFLDTYYINDCWGKPLVILQPEASARLNRENTNWDIDTDPVLKEYAFIYRYDAYKRLCYKKVPGCGPVTMLYDRYGRMAFMQDGNMRDAGKAHFTLYDMASRPVVTGICNPDVMDLQDIPAMTATLDFTTPGIGGSAYRAPAAITLSDPRLLSAQYYDGYEFLDIEAFAMLPHNGQQSTYGKGLLTGSLTAVFDPSDDNPITKPIASIVYYDDEERPRITLSSTHIDDVVCRNETDYTLDGKIKRSENSCWYGNTPIKDSYAYSYDGFGRLSKIDATFLDMDSPLTLVSNDYDPVGRIDRTENLGLGTEFKYNIRGALTYLSNPYRNQSLRYEDGTTPTYNGTISEIIIDGREINRFTYDGVGRLVNADFDRRSILGGFLKNAYVYDRNSNITSLQRMGEIQEGGMYGLIDNLTMVYEGNRLVKTTDNAIETLLENATDFQDGADNEIEYEYDSNGNTTRDDNRGIPHIKHNLINLPSRIDFYTDRSLEYVYDASGKKLSVRLIYDENFGIEASPLSPIRTTEDFMPTAAGNIMTAPYKLLPIEPGEILESRDYIGNYEFSGDTLLRINTPYGYYSDGDFYIYLHDYQGNISYVIRKCGENYSLVQSNEYYPYGLPMPDYFNCPNNNYKYGGKEFEMRQGLNQYDFLARTYMPDEARFRQPDPLAHETPWLSPYVFCGGDPVNFFDPDGMKRYFIDMDGRIVSPEVALNHSEYDMYKDDIEDDQIVIVDKDGKVVHASDTYPKGSITLHDNSKSDLKDVDVTVFEVNNKDLAINVFMFMAKFITEKNGIEYGVNIMHDNQMKSQNDVFTGHLPHKLGGFNQVFLMRFDEKMTFNEINHSHKCTSVASLPDLESQEWVLNKLKGRQKEMPIFNVFESFGGRFYDYILPKNFKKTKQKKQ